MSVQFRSYSIRCFFKLIIIVFHFCSIHIYSHNQLTSIIVISNMFVAFEHANNRLFFFSFVFSTSFIKRDSIDAATSSISLKKHRSEIENSLIAKSDQDLRSSISRRDRNHHVDTNEDYDNESQIISKDLRSPNRRRDRYRNVVTNSEDDFVSQLTSNALSNSDNFESVPFDVDIEPEFHLMSTETQDAHASESVDKTNANDENNEKSDEKEDDEKTMMNRYVYSDRQYVYTTCWSRNLNSIKKL